VVAQTLLSRAARLEPVPSSAGDARRLIRQTLAEVGEIGALEAAELAVSELVTNAILHAATPVELSIEVTTAAVTVSVRDWHPRLPTQRRWGATATTGRGLGLVASVTDAYGVDPRAPTGKSVWFRILRAGAAPPPDPAEAEWDVAGLLAELDEPASAPIQLNALPARLWAAGQQHWEAVLRELYLYAQSPEAVDDADVDLVAAGRALAALSSAVDRAVSAAVSAGAPLAALPEGHPSPLPALPESVDATLSVATEDQSWFGMLQDALDAGVRLGADRRLLIRPALPEIVALRDWACEQVLAQLHGVPPTPWAGTEHPRFVDPAVVQHTAPVPAWDASIVTDSDRSVVAADDNNRLIAVSRPFAQLLGWDRDELTGRRVVTIVPPSLREAHVAGFTRHLTTGETHVLGIELELPVLHADGTERQCRFLIERLAAEASRAVYLAWIDPV
jgi:PAS domain S-box-containing protein